MRRRKSKKKQKKLIMLAAIVAAIAIVITIVIIIICNNAKMNDTSDSNQNIGYDPNMQQATTAAADEGGNEGELPSVYMPGWKSITIPANTTEISSGINFFNPYQNEGYYDMTFELRVDLEGNGEYVSIYQSGLVSPNLTIQSITISRPVPEGEYDAIVFIQPYEIGNTETKLNNGQVNIKLIAE